MNDTIKVIVTSDKDEAGIAEQKLILKGYSVSVSQAKIVVLDGTDLGGSLNFLKDPDGETFVVFGTK